MAMLNTEQIMKLLPHRYPMLLVDQILECDDKSRIVGIKNVTANEPCFTGHFPGRPIMPGVLQLEAMAQTAGILLIRYAKLEGRIPYFMKIDKAKFRRVVEPGDQMRIEVDFLKLRTKAAKFKGMIYVGDELASEAEMMCMISDEKAAT